MSLFVAMSVKRIATHNKHRNRIITLHVLDLTFNDFPEKKMYWKKCMSQLKNQLSKA